jgi:hypothetical protein
MNMRLRFSHTLSFSLVSGMVVYAALSSSLIWNAQIAHAETAQSHLQAQSSATRDVLDKEPAGNIVKKEENDYSITYTRTKDVAVKNPFPSMISDEEIAKAFQHDSSIQKYFFTSDYDTTHTPMLIEDNILKDEPGTYTIYTVVKNYSTSGLFNKLYAQGYQTRNGIVLKDGSIYAGSKSTVAYTMHPYSFEFNGLELANNATKRTCIELQSRDHLLYYKITFRNDGALNERVLTNYGDETNTGGQSFSFFMYDATPQVSAQFHFVDDIAYRTQTHQNNADAPLKERGNTDEHPLLTEEDKQKGFVISALPHYAIRNLSDLGKPIATGLAHFMRNKNNDVKYTVLSFKDDPDAPKVENGRTTGVFRPTFEQLTSTRIPGYVYWDNDIDKPKGGVFQNNNDTRENPGNHYLSFAYEMKDGKPFKRFDTKHYYVTFRKVPTQIVVHQFKKDAATNTTTPLTTGSFDLYQRVGNNDVLIKKNVPLSKDFSKDTAPSFDSVVSAMKTKSALQKEGFYQVQDKLYLQPGSYLLRQTQAGEGTPQLADIPFTVSWQVKDGEKSDLVKEPSTLKIVEIDRNKLKPAPAPKPPAPTPAPEPSPAPSPKPGPETPVPTPTPPVPPTPTPSAPEFVPAPQRPTTDSVSTSDTPDEFTPQQLLHRPRPSTDVLPHTSDALLASCIALTTASLVGSCVMIAAVSLYIRKRQ